jgi:biopolymer transport protein ExbD
MVAHLFGLGQVDGNLPRADEGGGGQHDDEEDQHDIHERDDVDLINVPFVISLTADGNLFVNDMPVPDGGLPTTLNTRPRESAVVVQADKITVLEKFVALVDEIRGLGFQQVSLEIVRL